MRFTNALCALALMAPMPGFSQLAPPDSAAVVDAGSRVRIAAPVFGNKKQVGTVVSVTRDTLVLRQGAATSTRSLATSDITALEVANGTYTRKAKGALWGLLIGAGAGAATKSPSAATRVSSGATSASLDPTQRGATPYSGQSPERSWGP